MSAYFGKKEIDDLLTRLAKENSEYSIESDYNYNDIINIFYLAVHLFQKTADESELAYRDNLDYIIRRIHRMIMLFLDSFNASEVISILNNERFTNAKGEQISFYIFLKNTILYDDIINETTKKEGNIYPILCTGSFKDLLSVFIKIWGKNKYYLIMTGYPLTVFKGLRILNEMSANLYPLIIPIANASYTNSSEIGECENKVKYTWTDDYSSEKALVHLDNDELYIYNSNFFDNTLVKNTIKIKGLHSFRKETIKTKREEIYGLITSIFELLLDSFNYENPEDILDEVFLKFTPYVTNDKTYIPCKPKSNRQDDDEESNKEYSSDYESEEIPSNTSDKKYDDIRAFIYSSPSYRNQEKRFGIFNEISKLFYFIGCCQNNSPFQKIYSERQHLLRKSAYKCDKTQLFSVKYKSYIEFYKITGHKGLASFESIDDNISAIFEIEKNAEKYWADYYKILEEKWKKYWQEKVGDSINMYFIERPYTGYYQEKINTIITKDIFMLNPKNYTLLKIWGKGNSIVFSTKTKSMFCGRVEFNQDVANFQWRFISKIHVLFCFFGVTMNILRNTEYVWRIMWGNVRGATN